MGCAFFTVCTSEHRVQRLACMRWSMTWGPMDALVGAEKCLILILHFLLLKTNEK